MPIRPTALACLATVLASALAACSADAPDTSDAAPPGVAAAPPVAAAARAADPPASPEGAVKASMDRFLAARSFHATMTMEGAQSTTNQMDFVAPDRYRMQMPVGTQIIIGDTMYLETQGQTMKVPLPEDTLAQWRDPLRIEESQATLSVEAQGRERIDGQPARKYLVRHDGADGAEFTYWIGDDDLPLQLRHSGQSQGKPYTMTIRYTRFDDPAISIEAPQ
jgi:hypothetical protein